MVRNWLLPFTSQDRRCFAAVVSGALLVPALAFAAPCVQPDASGTVNMPPAGCPYVSPTDFHMIVNGFPVGTQINVGVEHQKFFNIVRGPGGSLGGEREQFNSLLFLDMNGVGGLAGFHRNKNIQAQCESHVGPRTPGNPVQSFDTDMFRIFGEINAGDGDPDFDLLRITAGTGFGMPSPGHTTLTKMPGGNWNVDSFFDITYRIDFVGKPGGVLGGRSGSTTGTIRMGAGHPVPPPPPPCTVADDGTGTVSLPPAGCGYVSPGDLHMMIDGLPPGTEIHIAAEHNRFFQVQHQPGGPLGGETEQFRSNLVLKINGTGNLAIHKTLNMAAQCQTSTAPRNPSANPQSFDTQMDGLMGEIIGDPDFDLLRITAGNSFGLPSPGHTTLTRLPGAAAGPGQWAVDSYFDITYRIDFVGRPGGALSGRSGSTTGTIRMAAGGFPATDVPAVLESPKSLKLSNSPNPFGVGTILEYRLPNSADVSLAVYDASGKRVRQLTDERLSAGPHAMMWDGRSDNGKRLGSGTYFVKLTVNGKTVATQKATIIK